MSGRLVHLLRHGETPLAGRLVGRTDCAVTDAGIAACFDQVEGLTFDVIVSSDLIRARTCAEAIAKTMEGPVRIDPRWRELDFGAWDGLAVADIDPAAIGAFWADPEACPPPEGERWSALVARVGAALGDLPAGDVLVVTHGGAMRAALAHLFGYDQRGLWAFDLPCASLLSFRLWPDGAQIVGLAP
jgi:alpha-ribazole phosphatase